MLSVSALSFHESRLENFLVMPETSYILKIEPIFLRIENWK